MNPVRNPTNRLRLSQMKSFRGKRSLRQTKKESSPVVHSSASKQLETRGLSIDELRENLLAASNPDAVVKATDAIGRFEVETINFA